jgi:hypothetical protein
MCDHWQVKEHEVSPEEWQKILRMREEDEATIFTYIKKLIIKIKGMVTNG